MTANTNSSETKLFETETQLPCDHNFWLSSLAVMDVADRSIVFDVNVEPLWTEVHRHHLAGLDNPALLR